MKNSTDVWFCAFLKKHKHDIIKYEVVARGKVRCFFNISDEDWQKMKLDFNKSELSEFKNLIDQIKDLAY